MSGGPPAPAPQRILPPLADQPIATSTDGRPTYSMTQWMQRVSAQIGPAQVGAGSAPGVSISEQVSNLTTTVTQLAASLWSDPNLPGNLAQLQREVSRIRFASLAGDRKHPTSTQLMPAARARPGPPFQSGLSGIIYLANGSRVIDGYGAPNGAVFGSVGDGFLQRDGGVAGAFWTKTSGINTNSGWALIGPTPASASIHTLSFSLIGAPPSGQVFPIAITQAGTLLANGGTFAVRKGALPTATQTLTVSTEHVGTPTVLGTISISTAGVVTGPAYADTSIAAGDSVTLTNQATADVTFATWAFGLQFKVT